ncbi:PREDICTED: caveolin-1 isoform X2 [Myotis brandtii]|uniref:caveolin-1 isoform X2 n=1 Tax=Myotis brandtii TaxID=109478 RepID=UPI000704680E|nr:PREDICTED: caveolin-1 isoform X2 [Myotis brandtii]XP_014404422.1 PREDICTED: caveolin-1 isoform X2 [Myotis brandtii]
MSGGKYVDSEGHLYTVPTREQGNIYKPNNKDMADEMNERQVYDAHTKEIDLVNRDPKHLNDHVVKLWARRRDARKRGRSQEGLAALEPPCCSTTVFPDEANVQPEWSLFWTLRIKKTMCHDKTFRTITATRKIGWLECQHVISMPLSYLSPWFRHTKQGAQGALVVFPNGVSTLLCCQWLHEVSLDLGTSKCPSCLQCLAQRRDLKSLRSALLMPVPHQSRWVN